MDVVITGANGFVGRHLTRDLTRAGARITGLVRGAEGARAVEEAGGRPVLVDFGDQVALEGATRGAEALVHLAQIGAERQDSYDEVNVRGTARVAAAARAAGVPRVVFLSGLGVARYGRSRRVTNPYFLSKLAAEMELFRSGLAVTVFRPSYIVGRGDAFLPALLEEMASGAVEVPGDGTYRMQPIAVADVSALVRTVCEDARSERHRVFDLVGPEPVTFRTFLDRFGRVVGEAGRKTSWRPEFVSVEEVERKARSGGYRGMLPDELDCMLCDEVANATPLEALLGRELTSLDEALRRGIQDPWLVSAPLTAVGCNR